MGLFDNPGTAPDLALNKQEEGQAAEGAGAQEGQQEGALNPEGGGQQQTEGQAEGQQQTAEQLILGKFKTWEDVGKAYQSLQTSHGRTKNELGQLRKQIKDFESRSQTQPQQSQGQPADWTEEQWHQWGQNWYEQEFLKNPGRAVFNLSRFIAQSAVNPLHEQYQALTTQKQTDQAIDSELGLLLTASDEAGQPLFPDAEQLADQIDSFLDENPYFRTILAEQGAKRAQGALEDGYLGAIKVIYDAVKSRVVQQVGQQAFRQGVQTGIRQARTKAGAALPGVGAKTSNVQVSPEQQVVNEIFAHKKGGLFG